MKIHFAYFLFLLFSIEVPAQQTSADSLLIILKTAKEDTSKFKALKNLSLLYDKEDLTVAKKYAQQAFDLAAKLNYQKGIGQSYIRMAYFMERDENYNEAFKLYDKAGEILLREGDKRNGALAIMRKGILYKTIGEYQKALDCYYLALKIDIEIGEKKFIAKDYGNISVVYWSQGNYPKALDFAFKVLKLLEETGSKEGLANTYGNIGSIYATQNNAEKALEYYLKGLKLDEELNNKLGIARNNSNIGVLYVNRKEYNKALDYYFKSLELYQEVKNKSGVANTLGNIGLVYENKAKQAKKNANTNADSLFNTALDYYLKGLALDEEIQEKKAIAAKMGYIGSLYTTQKKYKLAESYLLKALDIVNQIGVLDLQRDTEEFLYDLYNAKGDEKNAFKHYKQLIKYQDSLFNDEKTQILTRTELNYEFEKKEAAIKAEQEKKDVIIKEESKKQRLILIFISLVLALVFIFAIFILRSLRITRKQKELIEIKNKETEAQKAVIEEKQAEILQSIHYAKRIQDSLLPTEKYIHRNLKH